MKGLAPLFLGLFGTFAFSWLGLTVIPNMQIGALSPQSDEEGTDTYPVPKSGMADHGRRVFAANGCVYCHSQQIRPYYAGTDLDRVRDAGPSPRPKWGERRSAPRDYIFEQPVLLGQDRLGPDLANMGKAVPTESDQPPAAPAANASPPPPGAAPSPPAAPPTAAASAAPPSSPTAPAAAAASPSPSPNPDDIPPAYSEAWHHRHLYSPRSVSPDNRDSTMPAYRFLYEKHRLEGERSADALQLTGSDAAPPGYEIVPSYDAKCLVAYLMSLDQSHPLKEVKNLAAAGQPAGAPAAGASPAAPPAAGASPAAAAPGAPPPAPPPKK
ncbi:MAG TPA: cbb3-type cytochrome c oxidase subunit II [Chthoniobacterales bacterium]|jgi:cytochrome c oxidase cbb3-type subunit 2|nr:cbb3-type cytochrome c oxidase subunit II [Chthoniobacterales bacterium]